MTVTCGRSVIFSGFPPPINLTATIELKYSWVAINTVNQPTTWWFSWHVMFMTFWFSSSQRLLYCFAFPVFWHTALIIANPNNYVKNYINLDFNSIEIYIIYKRLVWLSWSYNSVMSVQFHIKSVHLLPKTFKSFVFFQYFEYEHTWWRFFQKRVACNKLDSYLDLFEICVRIFILKGYFPVTLHLLLNLTRQSFMW